uniref:Looped-hinge helix DNA binding domain-containing protein, AbrB family n=1 Tax=Candidatus Kentrum sp. FW TaxID=2126338 RepID=A0A450SIQ5_9GAMM|nr:MAG: looped-hinge helix DNA binding domain-containing protein, AbrB family [Candidatus Kentron sp. FW]
MIMATLSSEYRLALPAAIRKELGLKTGQKFSVITKGSVIELAPLPSVQSARGILIGANPDNYRDRGDRVE